MRKNSKRVPPALKHGIYSGFGLLPTESPAKLRKFKNKYLLSSIWLAGWRRISASKLFLGNGAGNI